MVGCICSFKPPVLPRKCYHEITKSLKSKEELMSETQVNDVAYGSMTIQGLQFDIKTPYKEGHMITAGEASQLNQVRMENIRNNFASVVRNAVQDYRKANGLDEEAEVPLDQLD